MPVVSVIITTYNRADLIRATIDSVLAQTHKDLEIIVADDGSTDETAAVVAAYGDRVSYVSQPHRRHDGAIRNLGIRSSSAEYVTFVDSDDLLEPTKIEAQLDMVQRRPHLGMVYSDGWYFDTVTGQNRYRLHGLPGMTPGDGWIARQLLLGNFIPTPSTFIPRRVFARVGVFREDPVLHLRSDHEMWLRIAARYEIGLIDEPLVRCRLHPGNSTRLENAALLLRSHLAVVRSVCAFAPDVYEPMLHRALAVQYSHVAGTCVASGRPQEARFMYAAAIRCDPSFTPPYWRLLATALPPRMVTAMGRTYMQAARRRSLPGICAARDKSGETA